MNVSLDFFNLFLIDYPNLEDTIYTYGASQEEGFAGRLKIRQDSSGSISFEYGFLGEVFNYVKDIAYDEYGQRAYTEYGNGITTHYTYNKERRWLETLRSETESGVLLQNLGYKFDKVGNVLSYTNDCLSNGYGSVTQSYNYDDLYQLTSATGDYKYSKSKDGYIDKTSQYQQIFTYDQIGNLTRKQSQGEQVQNTTTDGLNYDFTYEYDADYAHHVKQVAGHYYDCDSNGNITAISDTSFEKQYDFEAHMISPNEWYYNYDITDPASVPEKAREFNYQRNLQYDDRGMMSYSNGSSDINTKYLYDEDRNRTLKYDNTHDIEYLTFNDFYSVLINYNNRFTGGQVQKSIMLGNQRLVTRIDQKAESTKNWKDERTFYYLSDHLNSATLITDYKGGIFQSTEYTPYGERWIERTRKTSSDYYIPFRFTGKPLDTETGYYYFGARYYDPRLSVWTTSDPVMAGYFDDASKGGGGVYNFVNLNSYHYAGNNPVRYVDSTGEWIESAWDALSLSMGAASLWNNIKDGNIRGIIRDSFAVAADAAALVVPFVSGGVSAALQATRVGAGAVNAADGVANAIEGIRSGDGMKAGLGAAQAFFGAAQSYGSLQKYPLNEGFFSIPKTHTLQPGDIIDRYGYDGGTFFSPAGTPLSQRALPPSSNTDLYTKFEVLKPFDVKMGKITPYFGKRGMGIQYKSPMSASELMDDANGFIRKITE